MLLELHNGQTVRVTTPDAVTQAAIVQGRLVLFRVREPTHVYAVPSPAVLKYHPEPGENLTVMGIGWNA